MNPAQLLAQFNRLSDAPDAIPRLRLFILDLAVRGKLVEQDPRDEPACELLKRIQAEKERLVKSGNIRRQVEISQVEETEFPFEIPASWRWVRLIDVLTKLSDGTHHSPTNLEDGDFKYITAKNIKPEGVSLADVSYVTAKVHHEIYARCNPQKGDILYIKDGATTGIVTINDLDEPFSMLSSVALLKLSTGVYNRLIVKFLQSPFFYMQMRGFMKGAAITRVTLKRMAPALIPLPPFAEQQRIVAKVDELMALCDRLETAQTERENRRDLLVASSLNRLNNGADPDVFRDHARFYFNHLSRLTTRLEHIQQLRKTILNLAVRGKLVPQYPTDEAAEALLERVDSEREQLVKAKKIRRQDYLGPIIQDEIPFTIPEGWQWRYLADVCFVITDGAHHTPQYLESGVPFLSVKDVSSGTIDFSSTRYISEEAHRELSKRCRPEWGDVLLTKVGTTGIAVAIDDGREFSIFVSLALLKFSQANINRQYLKHLINSPFVRQQSADNTQGIGNKNLVLRLITQFTVPIPPLAEQQRIVAKVDELLALCDRLEAQFTTSQTESRHLLEAVLQQALAGDATNKTHNGPDRSTSLATGLV